MGWTRQVRTTGPALFAVWIDSGASRAVRWCGMAAEGASSASRQLFVRRDLIDRLARIRDIRLQASARRARTGGARSQSFSPQRRSRESGKTPSQADGQEPSGPQARKRWGSVPEFGRWLQRAALGQSVRTGTIPADHRTESAPDYRLSGAAGRKKPGQFRLFRPGRRHGRRRAGRCSPRGRRCARRPGRAR